MATKQAETQTSCMQQEKGFASASASVSISISSFALEWAWNRNWNRVRDCVSIWPIWQTCQKLISFIKKTRV